MAWRMKLKLPSFKLIQRSARGEAVYRNVPRGQRSASEQLLSAKEMEMAPVTEDGGVSDWVDGTELAPGWEIGDGREESHSQYPSLHQIKQQANVAAWDGVRSVFLKAVTESSALPTSQCCIKCSDAAQYRCIECGPVAYFCHVCFGEAHTFTNLFHAAEIWENSMFRPVVIENRVIDVRPKHKCSTRKTIDICCIDAKGIEHNVDFRCCECEPVAVTMVRARLWPATPQFPRLAFTFELLDWAEALLLECQVALQDLCKALYFKCPRIVLKRKDVYTSIIDAFEEYRFFKVELRHLNYLCKELDSGNVCPACPKEAGSLILSMDALFGLPRKKSAGKSVREPLHGHLFFKEQQSVDEFVESAPSRRTSTKVCSDFLAGDALRSATRFKALDETALFGCACRHEFPMSFINLKHGESVLYGNNDNTCRLAYGVWLLQQMLEDFPRSTINLMYDVSCSLKKHLEVNGPTELLECVKFSVPSFHAYGHKPACQIVFSPLRCDGLGLSDGEVMERMWSYLRRFSRMTKEMRPAHRVDILSHALLYYGFKTKQKLADMLLHRWKKAKELNRLATERFETLKSSCTVVVTTGMVEKWCEDERTIVTSSNCQPISVVNWKTTYFVLLQTYYLTRDGLAAGTSDIDKISRIESKLSEMEKKYGVTERWTTVDRDYADAKAAHLKEKQQQLKTSMWAVATRREYLLRMKAKYADGQKIAKKLSRGISKETNRARQFLDKYNAILQAEGCFAAVPVSEVLSLSSKFWCDGDCLQKGCAKVPLSIQKEMIDAYLRTKRTNEEIKLVEQEMRNVIEYLHRKIETITNQINTYQKCSEDMFNKGAICLLHKLLWKVELSQAKAVACFSSIIDVPNTCTATSVKIDDWTPYDSEDSDIDTDSDLEIDLD